MKELTIYQLTKAGNSFIIPVEYIDSEGRYHLYGDKRLIPKDKIINDFSEASKTWFGCRWFLNETLMHKIIHEEVQAKLDALLNCEEVVAFWKNFIKKEEED